MEAVNFQVVIEHGPENLSAYVPDLPGCIVTGKSVEQVRERMQKAIEMHIRGMIEDGLPIPTPETHAFTLSIPVQEYRKLASRRNQESKARVRRSG